MKLIWNKYKELKKKKIVFSKSLFLLYLYVSDVMYGFFKL